MADKERKKRICDDENCTNTFYQYKSTDKYCSYPCASKNTKPLKRTPLKPAGWTPEPKSKEWKEKQKKEAEKVKKNAAKKVQLSEFEKGAELALNGKVTKAVFIPDFLY